MSDVLDTEHRAAELGLEWIGGVTWIDGNDNVAVRLRDGTFGYLQKRNDDCMKAAMATVLQVCPDELPDPHTDKRVRAGEDPIQIQVGAGEAIKTWAAEHGLGIVMSEDVPLDRERWIGAIYFEGVASDHVLVMAGPELLHNPTQFTRELADWGPQAPPGMRPMTFTPEDVTLGVAFERI